MDRSSLTEFRIAQISDRDSVYAFAEERLKLTVPNDMDRMIKIWESRFRKEALNHYLALGWSFIAYERIDSPTRAGSSAHAAEKMKGFFIAQPLLFIEGQTQTLWVEELMADENGTAAELAEIAYKLSRDKHLQKVIFPLKLQQFLSDKQIKFNVQNQDWLWCKTTK